MMLPEPEQGKSTKVGAGTPDSGRVVRYGSPRNESLRMEYGEWGGTRLESQEEGRLQALSRESFRDRGC